MNATLKNLTITALALAGVIALAGCTADPTPAPTAPSAVETAAPTPSETPITDTESDETVETVSALDAGTVLTDAQAEAIRGKWQSGVKAYELGNGDKVLVKKSEPLPEPVQKAEEKKLAAVETPKGGSLSEQTATIDKLEAAKSAASVSTGKPVCVVLNVEYANLNGPGTSRQWVANGCPKNSSGLQPAGKGKAAVVSEAKKLIAAQSNASEWALIVEP